MLGIETNNAARQGKLQSKQLLPVCEARRIYFPANLKAY